jgi:hypothetical protein
LGRVQPVHSAILGQSSQCLRTLSFSGFLTPFELRFSLRHVLFDPFLFLGADDQLV